MPHPVDPRRVLLRVAPLVLAGALFAPAALDAVAGERRATPRETALRELGRRLFFDPIVSRSAKRSCASCHDPDHGFSDPDRVSVDDVGTTRRHSQTLLDSHLNPSAHWDGEFETVEELVLARIGALSGRRGSVGHGSSELEAILAAGVASDVPGGEASTNDAPADDPIPGDTEEGGGGDDDDNSYTDPPAPGASDAPESREAGGADAPPGEKAPASGGEGKAASPSPGAPTQPASPPAAKGARPPKPPRDAKAEAKREKEEQQAAERAAQEAKARAAALRADLGRLPLAEDVLEESGRYAEAFEAAFGDARVSASRIARAIASYCESIQRTESPFDRYCAGEEGALSAEARRGFGLFTGRAGCATCHQVLARGAPLTDFSFHNTGVAWAGLTPEERSRLQDRDGFRRERDPLEAARGPDEGRARVSTLATDLRAFKTPTLRDVARRGPYTHSGRFPSLADVVRHYAGGGSGDPRQDPRIRPFAASEEEVSDLVAFLESLSGDERPGLPDAPWSERSAGTRLRFRNANGAPLVGLRVRVLPAGDLAARGTSRADEAFEVETDSRGWAAFPATGCTHLRLVLPDGVEPVGGDLVPDTCRSVTIVVPVRGRSSLVVALPPGTTAPEECVAVHETAFVLPGHEAPRTRLRLTHAFEGADGCFARYEGWHRVDVPDEARVFLPPLRVPAARAEVLLGEGTASLDLRPR